MSSRNQLLIAIGIILLCSFVATSILNYRVTRDSVHDEILRYDLPLTMDNIYSELNAEIMRPLMVSSSMAVDTFLRDWCENGERDVSKIVRYLDEIRLQYNFFTTFFVSAETSTYYRYNGIHKTISTSDDHDVWFYNFAASGKKYVFEVDTDEAAKGALTVFINFRVMNEAGDFLGVTGVGLKVENVASKISEYQEKYHRSVYLVDTLGVVKIHPDSGLIDTFNIKDDEGLGELSARVLKTQHDPQNFEYLRDDSKYLLTARLIDSIGWILLVEQNETESLDVARKNFYGRFL